MSSDLFPTPESGWIAQTHCPAPKDGRDVVILGNLIEDAGDGKVNVEPVCGIVRYEDGQWVDGIYGMAVCATTRHSLRIRHWIAMPLEGPGAEGKEAA